MPFKSEKQRRWMHANEPEMAEEWEEKEKNEADAYEGHHVEEARRVKITRNQLNRIIREALSIWIR